MLLSWCGWDMQVYAIFMKMLTWACYEAFVTVAERKGCHGNYNGNGATATFRWSNNSLRCRCKRKWRERLMKRWWGAPGYRVPLRRRHSNEEEQANDNSDTVQHGHLIQHTFIRSRASSWVYTFEACISERVEFNEGSSGTRAVVEVVVLATVVEVVVHVRFREVLDESNVFGATVVVHTTSRYLSVRSCGVDVHVVGYLSHHRV